jgi:hypothetical protein
MFGSSHTCLLAILLSTIAPAWMRGQSERDDSALHLERPFDPRMVLPPVQPPILAPLEHRLPTAVATTALPMLVRAAGTIFSGTVTAIARRPATHGQAVETVAITFHVDNAIRGATPGEDLTIAQWIGLWSGGQRYRVGERVLLFLYPPSKLGLTSCVAGNLGRFSVDSWGRVLLSAQHLSAFHADPVLGGKSRVVLKDFALAVRRSSETE